MTIINPDVLPKFEHLQYSPPVTSFQVAVMIPEGSSFRMGTITLSRQRYAALLGPKEWSPRGKFVNIARKP